MMTECERIIAEGTLPESFLKEEEKDEFLVTEKQKKVWAVELDMLLKFDSVCKKHGLTYFLMFGSLLGAIRHHGFIPWDDDVDVGMPRKDYDKLLTLADEFEMPYFLQTPYTDEGYYYSYAKIRNSNTAGITQQFRFQKINWGLMLDVFPIDNVIMAGEKERYEQISKLASDNSTYMRMRNPYLKEQDKERVRSYSGKDPLDTYEEIQKIATQFNNIETRYVSVSALTLYSMDRNIFYAEDFKSTVQYEFEGFNFPVPVGYHRVLSVLYKDYMKFPPIEQRGIWHDNVLFDADIPYITYLKENTERV